MLKAGRGMAIEIANEYRQSIANSSVDYLFFFGVSVHIPEPITCCQSLGLNQSWWFFIIYLEAPLSKFIQV